MKTKKLIYADSANQAVEFLEKHLVPGDSDFLAGYLQGVKALANCLQQLPAAEGFTEWIPTSERLPERCEDVLICDIEDAFIAVGYLDDETRWVCRDWFFGLDEITHWMQLPELPKEDAR